MTTKYSTPTVEAIYEDYEDESGHDIRPKGDSVTEKSHRLARSPRQVTEMGAGKLEDGKEREKVRRSHRSGNARRHRSKREERNSNIKHAGMSQPECGSERLQRRHRRNIAQDISSSGSSSSEDEREEEQDHREVLAQPRMHLSAPSIVSTITSLTVSTNKSSGSSGSNSTVTQASNTKRNAKESEKKPAGLKMPMSPAVPDPPNVFAYLDNGSTVSIEEEVHEEQQSSSDSTSEDDEEEHDLEVDEQKREEVENDEESDVEGEPTWPHVERLAILPSPTSAEHPDSSSSASSSVHGSSHFSEENNAEHDDTDRSTSPERSVQGHASDHDDEGPRSPASDRMASQMAAAQERQNLHSGRAQSFGTPNMPRGHTVYPYLPAGSSLSPRYSQHIKARSLPRAEKMPVTGYELLASKLSNVGTNSKEPGIKPMYRKFEALNHRLLLHLQDELSELEEQLHRLDTADTQSRRAGLAGSVVPASRRAAEAAGGELQWHKNDILGRIGFKITQYNQALNAFNATQGLKAPDSNDIDQYREYLYTEHPIAEAETHFLDPADDLVSVCSETVRCYAPSVNLENQTSESISAAIEKQFEKRIDIQHNLSSLAVAIAVAVLVPILTFTVIPNFLGRMTVAGLVACGVVFSLIQSSAIRQSVIGREGLVCGGIYGGVMIVIAVIMG
ncbi:hypothetical protein BJ878DRAFT_514242 [Calycina marina]|uniref:DUF6594 domain-containing protein n=1 Tax=Calycina marina TaxID=1763456 RepID=A0A9P8CDJ8_9HELO|nr:hypothetical protein BJ878DRAFT_514242 [Calycina marina]